MDLKLSYSIIEWSSLLNMDVYMNDPKYMLVDCVDFVTNKTHIFVF